MTTGSYEYSDAAPHAGASAPLSQASGVDDRAKVRRSDSFANATKSTKTAAFTRVHEHSGVRRSERTQQETKRGESKRGRPIVPCPVRSRHGFARWVSWELYINVSFPLRGRPRDESTAHTAGSTTRACPTCTTRTHRGPHARGPGPCKASQRSHRKAPHSQAKIGRGGTERSHIEHERSNNSSWAMGRHSAQGKKAQAQCAQWQKARAQCSQGGRPFPSAREELKAVAQRN
ncbi:hypothetical protein H6P81_015950 [Aristolochia fimbriata]|uniref:Uncharacterized protein n=1 Tax=Aristolochia fimbriata TaxID=158543 RepID=A0AAV7E918_ARIFI|nr:hypothetical protein H6P81_015950 [Aristolochia fimbriata]